MWHCEAMTERASPLPLFLSFLCCSQLVQRRLWAQQEAESESDLRAAGIEVTELDEEEKARFRAAVQPMYDRFAQQGELIARIRQA